MIRNKKKKLTDDRNLLTLNKKICFKNGLKVLNLKNENYIFKKQSQQNSKVLYLSQ